LPTPHPYLPRRRPDLLTIPLAGGVLGLLILGIGSRVLMRVIANLQGQPPAFSPSGTFTVVGLGVLCGIGAGFVLALLRRFIPAVWASTAIFIAFCLWLTWRGANVTPPQPRLMFVAMSLVFAAALLMFAGRRSKTERPA
jgi:hypothetical protein